MGSLLRPLRIYLLLWAYFRLAVSIIWSGIMFIAYIQAVVYYLKNNKLPEDEPTILILGLGSVVAQLIEIAMITTFIVAGHKKNAKLYRIYFAYCITTLIVYIAVCLMFFLFDLSIVNFIVQNYITSHTPEISEYVTFLVVVCLEILLILLIKRQINKYAYNAEDDIGKTVNDV